MQRANPLMLMIKLTYFDLELVNINDTICIRIIEQIETENMSAGMFNECLIEISEMMRDTVQKFIL